MFHAPSLFSFHRCSLFKFSPANSLLPQTFSIFIASKRISSAIFYRVRKRCSEACLCLVHAPCDDLVSYLASNFLTFHTKKVSSLHLNFCKILKVLRCEEWARIENLHQCGGASYKMGLLDRVNNSCALCDTDTVFFICSVTSNALWMIIIIKFNVYPLLISI